MGERAGVRQTPVCPGAVRAFNAAQSLAIDPQNPSTVFAGAGGGVFKSTNGGLSWMAFSSGLTTTSQLRINGMQIDSSGKRIYASTDAGVFMITLSP